MTLVIQLFRTLLQMGSVIVLARLLLPADFGLVGMVTAVIGIATLLQDFGLSMAAIQSSTLSDNEQTNLFWANLCLGALCSLIAIACTPLIVAMYHEPRLTPIVPVVACIFLLGGFSAQYTAMLSRQLRFKALGLVGLGAQFASVVAAIVMAMLGAGYWSIVWQQVVYALVYCILNIVATRWLPTLPVRGVSIRRFMRFGIGVLGTQMISYATKNVDNIAIGAVWGASPLGFYSRAYQLMLAPLNKIDAPMTRVALPVLSKVQGDDARLARYLRHAQMVSCYITASVLLVIAGLAGPIVRIVFGDRWLPVAPILAILAVGGVFRTVSQIAYWAYMARGATDQLFRQRVVTGVLTIALILAGVPWGPVGVSGGFAVSAFAYWIIALLHVGKAARIDSISLLKNAAKIISCVGIPFGLAGWAGSMLPLSPILQVLSGLGIAGCYFAGSCLVLPWMRSDIGFIVGFARRSVFRPRRAVAT